MAEQEVIKHTKKIFSAWGGHKGFWHKLGDFLLEIFIIVFAISLSIYLHDRSVLKHQRHETKEFLLGLKQDLETDITEMEGDRAAYEKSGKAFTYITNRKMNERLNRDTIHEYYNSIFNTTGLIPNSGRFEGFKSAGKMGTIEDKETQNNIMDLYQENIPNLMVSTNNYTQIKQRLFAYLAAGQERITDSTDNLPAIMATNQSYFICKNLVYVSEIIDRYNLCLDKIRTIIEGINKEYDQ